MKEYDVIVVGSGSGMSIVDYAVQYGMKVALVDKGPLGGTCLNLGCIPSKMLITPADRIVEIQEAEKLGVTAKIEKIDFKKIMKRMREVVDNDRNYMKDGIEKSTYFDYYNGIGEFVADYTIKVNKEKIIGKKIFLVSGARPAIPPIKGIEDINYLTNETVLELEKPPKSLIIVGGGYVSVEYAHFFAAMGTKVTILQRPDRLLPNEEPEISELLKKELEKRMSVHVNSEVTEIKKGKGRVIVFVKGKEYTAEKIMIATGRKSNADLLKLENTGVKTDKRNYIIVNDYFETSKPNIYAFGDAIGKAMFKHVANEEAEYAWNNAMQDNKIPFNYSAVPYAIFTNPQIAVVGLTEEEARKNHDVEVGIAKYSDVAKGVAIGETDTFAKAIIDKGSRKILGFHIIGPYASILIQEVINALAMGGEMHSIAHGMHIHPALPELIQATLSNVQ